MREGFAFLWNERVLRSNTLLSTMAQVAVGAEIVVSLLYAKDVVDRGPMSFEQIYAWLLTSIAVGAVLAGIVVGAIGERVPKGLLVIIGFIGMGLSLVFAGLVTNPVLAIIAFFFTGASNMLFIIPTITLFQQRTPQRLMGRVVSSRQALVFGSIALSMGLSGWLAGIIGPALVLVPVRRHLRRSPASSAWPCPPCARPGDRAICYPSRAVGLMLDLAVVMLALLVIGSLALLAWTLGVSAVRAVDASGRE